MSKPIISSLSELVARGLKSAQRRAALPTSKKHLGIYALKNILRGRRVFVLGNGPSLKVEHLARLQGETTFAANMIYRVFEQTRWRPTFYVLGDAQVAKNYATEIVEQVPATLLLADFLEDCFPKLDRIVTFPKEHEDFVDKEPYFSRNPMEIVHGGYTVTYLILQLAWWMGAREFYVLGVDCKWNMADYKVEGQEGEVFQTAAVEKGATSYFIKDYFRPGEKCIKPMRIKEQILSLTAARKFIEGHGGRIFNAASESPLEVFKRVDFDSLFKAK